MAAASISSNLAIRPRTDAIPLAHAAHTRQFPSQILIAKKRKSSLRLRSELSESSAPEIDLESVTTGQKIIDKDVKKWVEVLKNAAKTRRVAPPEVLSALTEIKKAKVDPSSFLETLGGTESPGRTWMLIFTAQGKLERGSYFPLTAVQRFDAAGKRIENGVYLGPLGSLSFEGKLSWKTRKLAFIFESVGIKVGPLGPLRISLGSRGERDPDMSDPFFIWFYVDEEIAVAQGKGGGTAFWCRCSRV